MKDFINLRFHVDYRTFMNCVTDSLISKILFMVH